MVGLRYPRYTLADIAKPYDFTDYEPPPSPQRAAIMNRLRPPTPSVYERYGRPALEAVGGIVSAPFRGLGMGLTAAQEALAGTPDSESRLRLNAPGTSVLDDILGKSVTSAPSPAALALEGYKGIGEELAKDLFPDVLETPSAGRTPEDARAYAKEFPVISRAQSVLDPVTELAFQFVTDPALAGFGALSKSTEAAKTAQAALESGVLPRGAAAAAEAAVSRGRVANIAERALGASFVPGMAEAAFHGGTAAADSFRREGLSPETLRAGTEATLSAILAGTGAAHAVTPGLRPTAAPREALNPVLDDILGRAPEVRQEAPAAPIPAAPLVTAPPPVAVPTDLAAIDELVANAAPPRPEAPPPVVPEPVAPAPLAPTAGPAAGAPAPDVQLRQAEVLARQAGKATVGDLVNGLGVSPSKARRLLGQLEEQGVLGASDKNGVRALVAGAKPAAAPEAPATPAPPPVGLQPAAEPAPGAAAAEEAPKPHKFSSTQVNLPEPIAQKVKAISDSIPDADLGTEGRKQNPHVTVKYGLHTDDVAEVRKVLAGEPPIKVKLGKTSLFPPSESSSGADVLKVDVDSPDLHRLNKKISDSLETTDSHPDYEPHVTLAYIKAGEGKKYAGNEALAGQEMTLDHVTFTTRDGQVHEIPLGGTGEASTAATGREEAAPAIQPSSLGDRLGSLSERGGNRGEVATPAADASPVPPTFQEWLGNRRVPNDPNYVKGLREEYLKAYPNADRAQFQRGGGPKSAPFVEPKPEPVDVAGLKAKAAEEARALVPDADVDRDLAENVAPALARGIDKGQRRAGIASIKPELGIEGVQGDPKTLVRAIKQDADNPKYLELKEARRAKMADEREAAPTTEEPPTDERRRDSVVDRRETAAPVDLERRVAERRARILEEDPTISESHAERIARAEDEARTDPLTGLPNARAFQEALKTHTGPVVSMDLGGLGYVNDHLGGHPAGDAFLKAAADAMLEEPGVRPFRAGEKADEFALLADTPEAGEAAAKSIQERFSNAHFSGLRDGKPVRFTGGRIDYGTGTEGATAAERFRHGDTKLYESRERAVEEGLRPSTKGSRPVGLREVPGPGDVADSSPAPQGPLEPPPPSAASEPPAATPPPAGMDLRFSPRDAASARDTAEAGRLARILPDLGEKDLAKRVAFYESKGLTKSAEVVRGELERRKPAEASAAPVVPEVIPGANAARERIRARAESLGRGAAFSGVDPAFLADHALVGADFIAQGARDFGQWSGRMVTEFGESIKTHLKEIWERAQETFRTHGANALAEEPPAEAPPTTPAADAPPTPPRNIRPIPPTEPLGRPKPKGEPPRVETKVAALEEVAPDATLSRDAPRTWESLDPEIRKRMDALLEKPEREVALYEKARSGKINDVEVQTLDALVAGKREAYDNIRERLLKAQEEGRDTGPENTAYLKAAFDKAAAELAVAARSDVEAGTKLGRALAARARVMESMGEYETGQATKQAKEAIATAVDHQWADIIKRMKDDGVLKVECD